MAKKKRTQTAIGMPDERYGDILASMVSLLESARRVSARAVNSVMTATYWEIGRRIVELEQEGEERADYGDELIRRLSRDLTQRFGRGFGVVNLSYMRRFYLCWNSGQIFQTVSEESVSSDSSKMLTEQADAGQMHMYRNYAAAHWTHEDENPPVGLILCAQNDQAVARYALDGLPNKVLAAEYRLALPDEATLVAQLEKTQKQLARKRTV